MKNSPNSDRELIKGYIKKHLSFEKQLSAILHTYWFDPYNKEKYIADCLKAILEIAEEKK